MLKLYRLFRRLAGAIFLGILPPSSCRFTPTCSVYCTEAFVKYGPLRGSAKCVWRILRCNPFVKGGYDPA